MALTCFKHLLQIFFDVCSVQGLYHLGQAFLKVIKSFVVRVEEFLVDFARPSDETKEIYKNLDVVVGILIDRLVDVKGFLN